MALRASSSAEVKIAFPQHVAGRKDGRDFRTIGYFVQLEPIGAVRDDKFRAADAQSVLDGLGAKGGEERLINRSRAPDAQDGRKKFRNAGKKSGHAIAGADAMFDQHVGHLCGQIAHLGEAIVFPLPICRHPDERGPIIVGISIATLHTCVETRLDATRKPPAFGLDGEIVTRSPIGLRGDGCRSAGHAFMVLFRARDSCAKRCLLVESRSRGVRRSTKKRIMTMAGQTWS